MQEENKNTVSHLAFIKFEYLYISMYNLFD